MKAYERSYCKCFFVLCHFFFSPKMPEWIGLDGRKVGRHAGICRFMYMHVGPRKEKLLYLLVNGAWVWVDGISARIIKHCATTLINHQRVSDA